MQIADSVINVLAQVLNKSAAEARKFIEQIDNPIDTKSSTVDEDFNQLGRNNEKILKSVSVYFLKELHSILETAAKDNNLGKIAEMAKASSFPFSIENFSKHFSDESGKFFVSGASIQQMMGLLQNQQSCDALLNFISQLQTLGYKVQTLKDSVTRPTTTAARILAQGVETGKINTDTNIPKAETKSKPWAGIIATVLGLGTLALNLIKGQFLKFTNLIGLGLAAAGIFMMKKSTK